MVAQPGPLDRNTDPLRVSMMEFLFKLAKVRVCLVVWLLDS